MLNQAAFKEFVDDKKFQSAIIALIVINSFILALQAIPSAEAAAGPLLSFVDNLILIVFVVEIAMRICAHGRDFARDPWNLFDFSIVAVSFLSVSGLSALRAFRVFRILRLLSGVPRLRAVVRALFESLPGVGWVGLLLLTIMFVAAVIATHLFGAAFPQWFGDLFRSMFTLFQVMTLEGWPDIANTVIKEIPFAWIFFVVYILVATLTMLNMFVAIIVSAVEREAEDDDAEKVGSGEAELMAEIKALRAQVARLEERLELPKK